MEMGEAPFSQNEIRSSPTTFYNKKPFTFSVKKGGKDKILPFYLPLGFYDGATFPAALFFSNLLIQQFWARPKFHCGKRERECVWLFGENT